MEKLPNLVRRWYVYKITNPENQVYIGRTSNIKNRRDFIEQDLKVPEWKFLNDKGLKLTKKSKE